MKKLFHSLVAKISKQNAKRFKRTLHTARRTITLGIVLSSVAGAQLAYSADILISGYMVDPAGGDGQHEYVQLIATKQIDFAATNYSVVVASNGNAPISGWIGSGGFTYGFNLTSGIVNVGDVFYVGGSYKKLNGSTSVDISSAQWIRDIASTTQAGDGGLGDANGMGIMGNGGAADGIAVFSGLTNSLTATTTPIDALFYGSAINTANPSEGGYVLPNNDHYLHAQGTFGDGSNTFFFQQSCLRRIYSLERNLQHGERYVDDGAQRSEYRKLDDLELHRERDHS